jgi:Ni2+-binding GTPase involved in maturation of urease and hydrogenase
MELGDVYEFATWERDDEWRYENGGRYKDVVYDHDFGVYVGTHGKFHLFVTNTPDELRDDYKILYIENDMSIEETDLETNIPLLDKLIRYVNSREFEHPSVMSENETTYILVPEADILQYAERHVSNLGRNIQGVRAKHRTMRKKRTAGKKISDWMTILPPMQEIGFTGGPLYKRAEKSFKRFKNVFKGGETRKVRHI